MSARRRRPTVHASVTARGAPSPGSDGLSTKLGVASASTATTLQASWNRGNRGGQSLMTQRCRLSTRDPFDDGTTARRLPDRWRDKTAESAVVECGWLSLICLSHRLWTGRQHGSRGVSETSSVEEELPVGGHSHEP